MLPWGIWLLPLWWWRVWRGLSRCDRFLWGALQEVGICAHHRIRKDRFVRLQHHVSSVCMWLFFSEEKLWYDWLLCTHIVKCACVFFLCDVISVLRCQDLNIVDSHDLVCLRAVCVCFAHTHWMFLFQCLDASELQGPYVSAHQQEHCHRPMGCVMGDHCGKCACVITHAYVCTQDHIVTQSHAAARSCARACTCIAYT